MKKLLTITMLLLAFTLLVAVESDPSNVVGYLKYECVEGNNFVALPLEQGFTMTSEFGNLFPDDMNTVSVWLPSSQSWGSSTNYGSGMWYPDFPIEVGSTIFFNTYADLDFYSIGDLPETNVQYAIVEGNNTIMVPLNKPEFEHTGDVGNSIGNGETTNTVMIWNSGSQSWASSTFYGSGMWYPTFDVSIGTPLFLNSYSEEVWPAGPRGVSSGLKSINK